MRLLRSEGEREEVGHLSLEAIREVLLSPCSLLYCFCLATDNDAKCLWDETVSLNNPVPH